MEKRRNSIGTARAEDFGEWYQQVIKAADLAEHSDVRGCMVIKPNGYAIWELIQKALDQMIKETGHQNVYFPLLMPLSLLNQEAEHVKGFAKECAVVTHHRLEVQENGTLAPAADALLTEPLVIRPTSEAIIGKAMSKWLNSYNDLPLLLNQWCNVVRWELRTRLFLRTSEFLWQEGHTAHETEFDARQETLTMLDVYEKLAADYLAMPVIKGKKTIGEKFPGAIETHTIEAMMQDGKALQAGTSHFLGQNFSTTYGISFTSRSGREEHAWTTSWGASTRLVGALIMTHSDDDGLVLPPRLAPVQVTIIPMIMGEEHRPLVLEYCDGLKQDLQELRFFEDKIRVQIDASDKRAGDKFWGAVRRGVPLRVEIGRREIDQNVLTLSRRDSPAKEKIKLSRASLVETVCQLLSDIQGGLLSRAIARQAANTVSVRNATELDALFFSDEKKYSPFIRCYFNPDCESKDFVKERLERLRVSVRCTFDSRDKSPGVCAFTGTTTGTEAIVARAY
jgi:prolyl-tRNA synthetase